MGMKQKKETTDRGKAYTNSCERRHHHETNSSTGILMKLAD